MGLLLSGGLAQPFQGMETPIHEGRTEGHGGVHGGEARLLLAGGQHHLAADGGGGSLWGEENMAEYEGALQEAAHHQDPHLWAHLAAGAQVQGCIWSGRAPPLL